MISPIGIEYLRMDELAEQDRRLRETKHLVDTTPEVSAHELGKACTESLWNHDCPNARLPEDAQDYVMHELTTCGTSRGTRIMESTQCRSLGIALESSNAHATEPNWAGNTS